MTQPIALEVCGGPLDGRWVVSEGHTYTVQVLDGAPGDPYPQSRPFTYEVCRFLDDVRRLVPAGMLPCYAEIECVRALTRRAIEDLDCAWATLSVDGLVAITVEERERDRLRITYHGYGWRPPRHPDLTPA